MRQIISNIEEIKDCKDNTIVLLDESSFSMDNSTIRFTGKNNILFCEPDVHLVNSKIHFDASNSVIYLSASTHKYRANITVFNNCTCYIGEDCFFNGVINIVCSEENNVFIGRQGLLAAGVWIRTADPHLVYSIENNERINPSRSVYLGDHVWIGQNALILKGSMVHSGSIIGAGAVLAGQRVPSNTSFAGNPAKKIADGLFWYEEVVHKWTEKEQEEFRYYQGEESFVFESVKGETISFGKIDRDLAGILSAQGKLEYIRHLDADDYKDRFSWKKPEPKMTFRRRIRLKLKEWILRILK